MKANYLNQIVKDYTLISNIGRSCIEMICCLIIVLFIVLEKRIGKWLYMNGNMLANISILIMITLNICYLIQIGPKENVDVIWDIFLDKIKDKVILSVMCPYKRIFVKIFRKTGSPENVMR